MPRASTDRPQKKRCAPARNRAAPTHAAAYVMALCTDPAEVKVMVAGAGLRHVGRPFTHDPNQTHQPAHSPSREAARSRRALRLRAAAIAASRTALLDGPRLLLPPAGEGRYRLSSGTDVVVVGVYVSCLVYGSACRVVRSASARPSKPVGPISQHHNCRITA